MNVTEQFASFVVNTDFDELPEEAIKAAKIAITDCLGCILAGSAGPVKVHPDLSDQQGLKQHQDFAAVTLHLRDGQSVTRRVDIRLGSPGNPMSQKALLDKYRTCAQRVLPSEQIEQSITYLSRLETLAHLEELIASLQPAENLS